MKYKKLLKLKIGEQTVIPFSITDKQKYDNGHSGAWARVSNQVRYAEKKSRCRFISETGALGLLVTRINDYDSGLSPAAKIGFKDIIKEAEDVKEILNNLKKNRSLTAQERISLDFIRSLLLFNESYKIV